MVHWYTLDTGLVCPAPPVNGIAKLFSCWLRIIDERTPDLRLAEFISSLPTHAYDKPRAPRAQEPIRVIFVLSQD